MGLIWGPFLDSALFLSGATEKKQILTIPTCHHSLWGPRVREVRPGHADSWFSFRQKELRSSFWGETSHQAGPGMTSGDMCMFLDKHALGFILPYVTWVKEKVQRTWHLDLCLSDLRLTYKRESNLDLAFWIILWLLGEGRFVAFKSLPFSIPDQGRSYVPQSNWAPGSQLLEKHLPF